MSRYIDADVAQHIADVELSCNDAGIIQFVLSHTPTVDAVPVVRCKICKYGELDESDCDDFYLCHYHGSDWNEGDHFCSNGEKMDGKEE